jgi:PAS domain S-box-containing protein
MPDDPTMQPRFDSDADRARYVLETHPDGVAVVDADWCVRLVNRRYEALSQLTREQSLGKNLWTLFPEAAKPSSPFHQHLQRAMRERAEVVFEAYYAPLQSWASTTAYPAPGGGLVILYRDITAQRQAELAHQEAQAHTRLLVESIGEGVYGLDAQGLCSFVNPSALRLLGYADSSDLLGKQMHGLIHHSHADGSPYPLEECSIYRAMQQGEPLDDPRTTLWRADGSSFIADQRTQPMIREGRTVGAVVTFVDVTAQEQREQQRRWLEEAGQLLAAAVPDFEQLLASLGELIVPQISDWYAVDLLEEDGRTRLAAVAHQEPDKVALARDYRHRYPPGPESPYGAYAVIRSGEAQLMPVIPDELLGKIARDAEQLRILREIGMRSGMVLPLIARGRSIGAMTLVSTRAGTSYGEEDLAFGKELAARIALAIDNAQLYAQARQAVQLREDVLAVVSHDLKSPLGAVSLAAATLERRSPSEADRKLLQNILRAGRRMDRLINDLLDMASLRASRFSVKLEPTAIKPLFQEALELKRPHALEKEIELRTELMLDDRVKGMGDHDRLIQVIGNLLGNAIKFTQPGGRVILRASATDATVLVEVEDNGPGIDLELLPKLFTPYWSAKHHRRLGTGLGLYISQGIVEAHGGHIEVRSEQGVGTLFTFELPRQR